jgi:hypothetical protein
MNLIKVYYMHVWKNHSEEPFLRLICANKSNNKKDAWTGMQWFTPITPATWVRSGGYVLRTA